MNSTAQCVEVSSSSPTSSQMTLLSPDGSNPFCGDNALVEAGAAFVGRAYVKWREPDDNYQVLGNEYSSIDSAIRARETWRNRHKKWISTTYNVSFNS